MKTFRTYLICLIHICVSFVAYTQEADYNTGNSWVHPSTLKQTGINFTNTPSGELLNNGTVWYVGDFYNNGIVGYNSSKELKPGLSRFDGTVAKTISGSGTTRFYRVWFSAPGFKLQQNITVDNEVDFDKGIIQAEQTTPQSEMNMVKMNSGSSWVNASDACYVDGFVEKTGNTAFGFPIGNGGYYRPASISAPASALDVFSARYIYGNPSLDGYPLNRKSTGVGIVSDREYWIVKQSAGTSLPLLTLTWDATKTSALMPTDLTRIQIARWDGSQWISEGRVDVRGNSTAGSITAKVTGFGVFALSTVTAGLAALPDTLTMVQGTTFNGTVAANDTINGGTVTWTVTTNPLHGTIVMNADGHFEYQPDGDYFGSDSCVYTLSDGYGNSVSAKVLISVKSLSGYLLVNKHSTVPVLQGDGKFIWNYHIVLTNLQSVEVDSVHLADDLTKVFVSPVTFTVTEIAATGGLKSNGLYDGMSHTDMLVNVSKLAPNSKDSITITVSVDPHEYVGPVYNQAVFDGKSQMLGQVANILTDDETNTESKAARRPTVTQIPKVEIAIPDAFSPNNDGLNDTFFIPHDSELELKIEVFNRWGVRVYKNNNYMNEWDGKGTGTLLGSDLLDGTYYYIIETTHRVTGEVKKYSGFVTLKR